MYTEKEKAALLSNGLQRHALVLGTIAQIVPDKKDLVIELARMMDELLAAAIVDNLQKCDTPEKKEEQIQKIYEKFGHRWVSNEQRMRAL